MVDKRVAIIKDVVLHPTQAFREIAANGRSYFFVAIGILLASSITFLLIPFDKIGPEALFIRDLYNPDPSKLATDAGVSIGLEFAFVILVYYIGRFFKGKADFRGLFSALKYADIPAAISAVIFFYIFPTTLVLKISWQPGLISLAIIAASFFIWSIILTILACKEAHTFGTGRSIATLLISMIIIVIIAALSAYPMMQI